jgi:hypothetical protein
MPLVRNSIIKSINDFLSNKYAIVLIPVAIFVVHTFAFQDLIYDDAGISFAYARSLANGYGLTAQPGREPVEGFSNFLWVIFLTPFFRLDLFHPLVTPKVISAVLIAASFPIIVHMLSAVAKMSRMVILLLLTAISSHTVLVAWSMSGLEHGLLIFLLATLYCCTTLIYCSEQRGFLPSFFLGVIAAALAMTRPEAILFSLAYPTLLAGSLIYDRERYLRGKRYCHLLAYLGPLMLIYGCFLLFSWWYFGSIFPNTYVVKGGPNFSDVIALVTLQPRMLARISDSTKYLLGPLGNLVLLLSALASTYLVAVRRFQKYHVVAGLFFILSLSCAVLLPETSGRYNIPFILCSYIYIALLFDTMCAPSHWWKAAQQSLAFVIFIAVISGALYVVFVVSKDYARRPWISFASIGNLYGKGFNHYADVLNILQGSFLLPDVGGTLYYSKMKIYDLAGLCDKRIALTLRRDKDLEGFHNYVLGEIKPTFIETHGVWTYFAQFDQDKRFRELYTPIVQYNDPWVRNMYGLDLQSGVFVLKEAVLGQEEALGAVRAELVKKLELANSPESQSQ